MQNPSGFLDPNGFENTRTTQIKVCGITRIEDALHAVKSGADALGLIFYPPSGRNVSSIQAKQIRDRLPADVACVAVVVDPDDELLSTIVNDVKPDYIQFHGEEPESRCREHGIPFIKALRVRRPGQVDDAIDAYPEASGLLLDAYDKDKVGGTGKTFSWDFVPQVEKPIILAGGLHRGNIAEAIHKVRPVAVDVSTGVEISIGIKNRQAISEFVAAVRSADRAAC